MDVGSTGGRGRATELRQRESAGLRQREAELSAHGLGGVVAFLGALAQDLLRFLLLLVVEVFDQQDTVEVIEFVLKEARFELISFDVDLITVEIVSTNMDRLWSNDMPRESRYGQAAFVELPLAIGLDDLGVDERVRVEAFLGEVVDEQTLADAYLWCSQAKARFVVHRLEHVVDEANEGTIDVGDVFGHLFEDWIAIVANAIGSAHHHPRYRCGVPSTDANQNSDEDARSASAQYFDAEPTAASNPRSIELVLPDVFLTLGTDSGVFSNQKVDAGTRYLLQTHPPIPESTGRILDLGCGYGPIALTAARRASDAEVWGVDVNSRALDLARANANANDIANARFGTADEVPADVRFDLIISNPPIRIGKQALHELLEHWLDRLTTNGRAWMVVQKHLGSDSLATWLSENGWATTKLGSRKGYRIVETHARSDTNS